MSLVDPARAEAPPPSRRSTRSTVVLSLVLHALILAAVVVVPLFGLVPLPDAHDAGRVDHFVRAATLPAPPPEPRLADARPPSAAAAPPTAAPAWRASSAVPLEAPDRLPTGEVPALLPGARPGDALATAARVGVAGGIDGGVPGPPAAAPAPPATRPLRVGGDIRPPRKLHHVTPVYPSLAAQTQTTGTVILEATIAPTGDVVDVRVLRSVRLLDAAAVDAVRQWRYEPPRLNGIPIAVLLTVTVRFGPE